MIFDLLFSLYALLWIFKWKAMVYSLVFLFVTFHFRQGPISYLVALITLFPASLVVGFGLASWQASGFQLPTNPNEKIFVLSVLCSLVFYGFLFYQDRYDHNLSLLGLNLTIVPLLIFFLAAAFLRLPAWARAIPGAGFLALSIVIFFQALSGSWLSGIIGGPFLYREPFMINVNPYGFSSTWRSFTSINSAGLSLQFKASDRSEPPSRSELAAPTNNRQYIGAIKGKNHTFLHYHENVLEIYIPEDRPYASFELFASGGYEKYLPKIEKLIVDKAYIKPRTFVDFMKMPAISQRMRTP